MYTPNDLFSNGEYKVVFNTTCWRHKKRGTIYAAIGTVEVQATDPIKEGDSIVVCQGEDGKLWARPVSEFIDGRFERIK